METYDPGHDWSVNLHMPMSIQQTDADQQVNSFKDKWVGICSDVPVRKSDRFHSNGRLLDGVHAEIYKGEGKYMVPPLMTAGSV
eukprot:8481207-Prorocentrum_lima.AAC.1